jgi:hypothetical protein
LTREGFIEQLFWSETVILTFLREFEADTGSSQHDATREIQGAALTPSKPGPDGASGSGRFRGSGNFVL